jgi:putative membrane-bound dehydrogenase-like protein
LASLLVLTAASCGKREPPLSPEDALGTFQLPPGFRIELVAVEPEIADPVAMAFDPQGRLYVAEMADYPLAAEPKGLVKMLEDRDADGRFEHSTVFADQLHFPSGVMAWRDGVLVTSAPDILYMADTDGDGRADVREVVLTGFAKTNPQLRVNGLQYAIDNWVYVAYPRAIAPIRYQEFADLGAAIRFPDEPGAAPAEIDSTDVRFRPARKIVEAAAGNSEFGNAFDAWGNRFTVWNNDHVRHVVIANRYLTRNPYLSVASAMQSASDHENAARVYLIADSAAAVRDSEKGSFTSAAGISVYTGGAFPPEYDRSFFVCEPVHHLVHHDLLTADGSTFVAKRSRDGVEFLASTDSWFSPAFTTVGPDGALYVVDYYRPILEHPEWIPPEQLQGADLYAGSQQGRIYRVVHESAQASPAPRLGEASSSELVEHLSRPNMWWRITAQRLLVERGDEAVVPALTELARNGSELARLHALWTLEGLEALSIELVLGALADPSARVRENAVRLAESSQRPIREGEALHAGGRSRCQSSVPARSDSGRPSRRRRTRDARGDRRPPHRRPLVSNRGPDLGCRDRGTLVARDCRPSRVPRHRIRGQTRIHSAGHLDHGGPPVRARHGRRSGTGSKRQGRSIRMVAGWGARGNGRGNPLWRPADKAGCPGAEPCLSDRSRRL